MAKILESQKNLSESACTKVDTDTLRLAQAKLETAFRWAAKGNNKGGQKGKGSGKGKWQGAGKGKWQGFNARVWTKWSRGGKNRPSRANKDNKGQGKNDSFVDRRRTDDDRH